MSRVRTVLIGFGTAIVLGLPSLHHANAQYYEDHGGYQGYDYYGQQRRQRNEDIYQRQQRADELLERELRRTPPIHETEEFRGWDDRAARRRCNALTNNDAARSSCFEGLR